MTKKEQKSYTPFGVHSEVGQLRKVMVSAPGRSHQRLTPSNCDELLFETWRSLHDLPNHSRSGRFLK